MSNEKLIQLLIDKGYEELNLPYKKIEFTEESEADNLLNDLRQFPHAFVLGCIMDTQIPAERAWIIPYYISQEIGGFEFENLLKFDENDFKNIFNSKKLHRFNDRNAKYFYSAIQDIHEKYEGDASKIWINNPKSATIVRRFLEFKGVGIKISTMATNILLRAFKIPMQDICIDISPDRQVKRGFRRLGLISKKENDIDDLYLIYRARELHKDYPGVFDYFIWELGKKWCKENNPICGNCYLNKICPKNI